jgi:hypothetical protein
MNNGGAEAGGGSGFFLRDIHLNNARAVDAPRANVRSRKIRSGAVPHNTHAF